MLFYNSRAKLPFKKPSTRRWMSRSRAELKSYWKVTAKSLQSYCKVTAKLLKSYCRVTEKLLISYWKVTEKLLKSYCKVTAKLPWPWPVVISERKIFQFFYLRGQKRKVVVKKNWFDLQMTSFLTLRSWSRSLSVCPSKLYNFCI